MELLEDRRLLALVGHWMLEETAIGQPVADSSGSGNSGVHTNISSPQGPDANAAVGSRSLSTDGVDDYVSIGSDASLDLSAGLFSQSVWIYSRHTDSGFHGVLGYHGNGVVNRYPGIWIKGGDRIHAGFGDGSSWNGFSTPSVLTPFAWNHLVTTFDGTTYRVYVDGGEVFSTNDLAGKTPTGTTQRLDIGRVDNYFDGLIDDVRIYNEVLSASEVNQLFNGNQSAPGTLAMQSGAASIDESGGSVTLTVLRTGGSDGVVTVNYATSDASATAPSDYGSVSGTLTFGDGVTSQTIDVPIVEDAEVEGNETLNVTLSSVGGGATLGAPSSTTVTIVDNDNPPAPGTLAMQSGAASIDESGGSVTLTVLRTGGSDGVVTVDYATSDASATAPSDYGSVSGTLTFGDGVTSQTIDVPIVEDAEVEGNETLNVTLSSVGGGATLGAPSSTTVTIVDNDNPPAPGTLALQGGAASIDESGGSITLTVLRTGGSDGTVTVDYATLDASATAPSDYGSVSGTLTFGDGVTSQTIDVPIVEDTEVEGNETLTVTLSSVGGGATLGAPSSTTVTIVDNDTPPPPSGLVAHWALEETAIGQSVVDFSGSGNSGVHTNISSPQGPDANAAVGSRSLSTDGVDDYVSIGSDASLDLSAGLFSQSVWIYSRHTDSGFHGVLGYHGNGVVNRYPGIWIKGGDRIHAGFGDGSSWNGFSTPSVLTPFAWNHLVTTFDGTTYRVYVDGGEVYSTNDLAGKTPTATTQRLDIGRVDNYFDGLIDDVRIYNEVLSASEVNQLFNGNQSAPGTLAMQSGAASIDESGGSVTVTVLRTGGSDGVVTVDYATSDASATAPSDYGSVSGTLTFGDGVTSQTIDIPILEDTEVEGNETLNVTLSAVGGGATLGAPSSATVTIVDNDNPPAPGTLAMQSGAASIDESGGTVTLTVLRTGGSDGVVTVDYATSDASATAPSDYGSAFGTLTFGDGVTSQTIDVPIVDDTEVEGNETLTVTLSSVGGGATLGAPNSTTVTIIDNDNPPAPGTLAMQSGTASIDESGGLVTLTVLRTGGSDGVVTVDYATSDASATAPSDYGSASGTLTFGDGVTSQTIDVPIVDDTEVEGNETLSVTLSSVGGGATLGTPGSTTVTIVDNDTPPPPSGLVAHWALDETAIGQSVVDSSGSGNSGVHTNISSPQGPNTDAVIGSRSLSTDGVDDYVSIGSDASLDLSSGLFSQSVWIYSRHTDSGFHGVLGYHGNGVTNRYPGIWIKGGDRIHAGFGDGSAWNGFSTPSILTPFAWNHVATTFDGTTYRVYVDGIEAFSTTDLAGKTPTATTQRLDIGRVDNYFDGLIDDVRIYNKALTAAEVSALANPGGGSGVIQWANENYTVIESAGSVSVEVVRVGGSEGTATVNYTSVNGTATSPEDYTSVSDSVTFLDGETSKFISVPIVDDSINESTETFTVSLDASTGAPLGFPRTRLISILDDDSVSGSATITFAGAVTEVDEDAGTAQVLVLRLGDTSAPSSVSYATSDGTATAGSDYTAVSGTLDFGVSETSKTIDIPILDDSIFEANETIDVTLSSPVGAVLGAQNTAEVRILEDDPADFVREAIIDSNLSSPTTFAWAPDGRMFVAQKNGEVKVFDSDGDFQNTFIDLRDEVNDRSDRGLLGFSLHPDFPSTPYAYLLYAYDPPETQGMSGRAGPDGSGNRVNRMIRVSANSATNFSTVLPGSEVVILGTNSTWENISQPDEDSTGNVSIPPSCPPDGTLTDCLPLDSRSHAIGTVKFSPDGSALFVSVGDGTSFGIVDPRTVRVQDLDSLSGKILRIDPITGQGLADNPFYDGDPSSNRSKVYSLGLRNPFRFTVHPQTGEPFIGDVGWGGWEEINTGAGVNFGWPYYEGGSGTSLQTNGYKDLPEAQAFYASGAPVEAAIYARAHSAGANAIVMGDFYTGNVYPSNYQGALFFADLIEGSVDYLTFDGQGDPLSVQSFATGISSIVHMVTGPDGYLYFTNIGSGTIERFVPAGSVNQSSAALGLEVGFASASRLPQDVNDDGQVSGLDALVVINQIDRNGPEGEAVGESVARTYPDVNGDRRVTAVDALQVINYMSRVTEVEGLRRSDAPARTAIPTDRAIGDDEDELLGLLADDLLTQSSLR